VLEGVLDRLFGDLVEDHALDRHLRLEDFGQVPGYALALAVFVGRQDDFVGFGQRLAQRLDDLLLALGDHVKRLEVRRDVDAQPRPLLVLHFGRNFRCRSGQVADVAHARLDAVLGGQEAANGARFGR